MLFTRSNQVFVPKPENIPSLDAEASKELFSYLVEDKPTLDMALRSAGIQNSDIVLSDARTRVKIARKNKEIASLDLTDDEAGAIACYTLQVEGSKSPYSVINECLSMKRNGANLNSSRRLIFLLLSGLRKLPRFRPSMGQEFYRGIRNKVSQTQEEANGHQYYAKGKTVTWWGFTSTTADFDIVNNFIEKAPESTLFNIGGEDLWGYSIKAFSEYPNEEEVLIEPEAKVFVSGVVARGSFSTINVALQKFEHLVLEDIIPVGPASQLKQVNVEKTMEVVKVNLQKPQGLKVESNIVNGFEVSWSPVSGEGISYQVEMAKSGPSGEAPKIIYNGSKISCFVTCLKNGEEYMFRVRGVSGPTEGEWSEKVVKKVEQPSVVMAVNTLKKCVSSPSACKQALVALTELGTNDGNRVKAGMCGGIEMVVSAMKKHINNAADNEMKAGECGAIEIIVNVLKTHINNAGVCEQGCKALVNNTFNADNKVKAEKCGAVSVILRILKTHIKNADVCEQGCKALVNSIYNGKIVIPQCKDEIERINLHNNR